MTKKHYQAAALECHAHYCAWLAALADGREVKAAKLRHGYVAVRDAFIRFFRADNIRFDERSFTRECEGQRL